MEKIHKLNYEFYALDYMDGELTVEEREAFEQFLAREPEVAQELEGLEEMVLEDRPVVLEEKSTLYRHADEGVSGATRWWALAASWAFLVVAGSMGLWLSGSVTSAEADSASWVTEDIHPMEVREVRVAIGEDAAVSRREVVSRAEAEEAPGMELESAWAVEPAVELPGRAKIVGMVEKGSGDLPYVEIKDVEAVAVLPSAEMKPLSTAFDFQAKVRANSPLEMNENRKDASVFSSDKIAILEPISKLLTEDQKDWVAQWRPMETLKQEVDRGRWMEAITPEFLHSSK